MGIQLKALSLPKLRVKKLWCGGMASYLILSLNGIASRLPRLLFCEMTKYHSRLAGQSFKTHHLTLLEQLNRDLVSSDKSFLQITIPLLGSR